MKRIAITLLMLIICGLNTYAQDEEYLLYEVKAHQMKVNTVKWKSDGTQIISGGEDGMVLVLNAATGEEIYRYNDHVFGVQAVDWSPDNSKFMTTGWDGRVNIYNADTGEMLKELKNFGTSMFWTACWSPDGTKIAVATFSGYTLIWDVESGELLQKLFISEPVSVTNHIRSIHWNFDGTRLLTAATHSRLALWNPNTGEKIKEYKFYDRPDYILGNIDFSPDGKYFVGPNCTLYDGISGDSLRNMYLPEDSAVVNNTQIFWGGQVFWWDNENFAFDNWRYFYKININSVQKLEPFGYGMGGGHYYEIMKINVSSSGKFYIRCRSNKSDGYGNIDFFDYYSGNLIYTLDGHTNANYADLSPDGYKLVSCGDDSTIKVWDFGILAAKEKAQSRLNIMPNPASSETIIELPEEENSSQIEIYDMLGNMRKSIMINSEHRIKIDISELQAGAYILRIGEKSKFFVKE